MTKFLFPILCVAVLWPVAAAAGALYGTVRIGQAPADRVTIKVACPRFGGSGRPPPTAVGEGATDSRGSYSLRVEAVGPCKMQLQRDGRVGTEFDVFVSNNSLRLDVEADAAMNKVR